MEEKKVSFNREIIESGQTEQLQKLCECFEQLQEKENTVGQQEKSAYSECLEQLKQKRSEAEAKLAEMQQNTTDGFYEVSLDSQIALDKLKEALCEAQEKYVEPSEQEEKRG
jgi:hypothetical protein